MNPKIRKAILQELGFLLILFLLVVLFNLLTDTFFDIGILEYNLIGMLVIIFYFIIGFYRILNSLARKYRKDSEN